MKQSYAGTEALTISLVQLNGSSGKRRSNEILIRFHRSYHTVAVYDSRDWEENQMSERRCYELRLLDAVLSGDYHARMIWYRDKVAHMIEEVSKDIHMTQLELDIVIAGK